LEDQTGGRGVNRREPFVIHTIPAIDRVPVLMQTSPHVAAFDEVAVRAWRDTGHTGLRCRHSSAMPGNRIPMEL